MNIGIITFHRSHNYGSVLQAYALQKWLLKNNADNEILDLYTEESEQTYKIFRRPKTLHDFGRILFTLLFYVQYRGKFNKFSNFILNKLILSKKTYRTNYDLNQAKLPYTHYISGSDQIWNTACFDFNWAYFLNFVKNGKKIAYATSFGPIGEAEQKNIQQVAEYIKRYNCLSVREKGSADFVKKITGLTPTIALDPTLLLVKKDWEKLLPKKATRKGKYIFFYTLKNTPDEYEIVKQIGIMLKLPVVISKVQCLNDLINGFKFELDSGPEDFLSLINEAKLVLISSFHGTVFSLMFEKDFYSINGDKDNRISSLLENVGCFNRCININNYREKILNEQQIDYSVVPNKIRVDVIGSELFLKNALGMEVK